MKAKKKNEPYPKDEAKRRMEAALRGARLARIERKTDKPRRNKKRLTPSS